MLYGRHAVGQSGHHDSSHLHAEKYNHHDKSDPNNKIEEEWGSLFDCPVCYDDIQDGAVKDWQWIDLMTRKFASRGKFANRGVML
jgi:hypothetical protein